MLYGEERAASVVLTWKYCTLEMPAVGIHLKGVEARRAEVLAACVQRALEAITEHSTSLATAAVERQGQAATHKAREAEWGLERTRSEPGRLAVALASESGASLTSVIGLRAGFI